MMKKLILAAVVCVGSMALTSSTAEAGDCYYRAPRPHVYSYRAPVSVYRSYGVYRPPVSRYVVPGYRPYPVYRPSYPGYIGPGVRFGYPGYYGYGRSGISIGIGF